MSICSPCVRLKQISLCTDSVVIGEVPLDNVAYVVYFRSLATGATYSYNATSNANGIITLAFPDGFPLADGQAYEMWVNELGSSIESQEDLIIGTTTAKCYTLSAIQIYNMYYGYFDNYDEQILETI